MGIGRSRLLRPGIRTLQPGQEAHYGTTHSEHEMYTERRRRRAEYFPVTAAAPELPGVEVLVEEEIEEHLDSPWHVILYNDDVHTFDEVILQLVKATGCTTPQAEAYAWEVHTKGKAAVFEGSFEECFRVQGVLREIQLVTEIEG